MKQLNKYIQEKLIINKDIKINYDLSKEYLLVYYYTPTHKKYFEPYLDLWVGNDFDFSWKIYLISFDNFKKLWKEIENDKKIVSTSSSFLFFKIELDKDKINKFIFPEEFINFYKGKRLSLLNKEYGISYHRLLKGDINKIIKQNEII